MIFIFHKARGLYCKITSHAGARDEKKEESIDAATLFMPMLIDFGLLIF